MKLLLYQKGKGCLRVREGDMGPGAGKDWLHRMVWMRACGMIMFVLNISYEFQISILWQHRLFYQIGSRRS